MNARLNEPMACYDETPDRYVPATTTTTHQKRVLRWMDERNLGAVLFEGSYRFPVHFRNDPDLAERLDRRISLGFERTYR